MVQISSVFFLLALCIVPGHSSPTRVGTRDVLGGITSVFDRASEFENTVAAMPRTGTNPPLAIRSYDDIKKLGLVMNTTADNLATYGIINDVSDGETIANLTLRTRRVLVHGLAIFDPSKVRVNSPTSDPKFIAAINDTAVSAIRYGNALVAVLPAGQNRKEVAASMRGINAAFIKTSERFTTAYA